MHSSVSCHCFTLPFFPRSFNELYWLLHSCTHPFYSLSSINSFVCSADSSDDPMNRCKAASTHWTALPRALAMRWEGWPCRSCGTWAVSVLEEIWNYSTCSLFIVYTFDLSKYFFVVYQHFCWSMLWKTFLFEEKPPWGSPWGAREC